MRTYVDIFFTSDGASPMRVAEALRRDVGLSFVFGQHDFVITWHDVEELHAMIEKLTHILQPMGVFFRFESHEESADEEEVHEFSWPPMLPPKGSKN